MCDWDWLCAILFSGICIPESLHFTRKVLKNNHPAQLFGVVHDLTWMVGNMNKADINLKSGNGRGKRTMMHFNDDHARMQLHLFLYRQGRLFCRARRPTIYRYSTTVILPFFGKEPLSDATDEILVSWGCAGNFNMRKKFISDHHSSLVTRRLFFSFLHLRTQRGV